MGVPEKADIREQYGSSVNSNQLTSRADAYEMPVDRLAAMGGAVLAVASGAARQGLPVAAVQADVVQRARGHASAMAAILDPGEQEIARQERLAAEAGSLLWHLIYGGQHDLLGTYVCVPTGAVLLLPGKAPIAFSAWLRHRPRLADATDTEVATLAMRVLTERINERCQACGGSGKQERTPFGNWVRPLGRQARNANFRTCEHCSGSRRMHPAHPERARLLGLTREKYDAARWGARFNAAHVWVEVLARKLRRPLTGQLERRKRRT